MIYGDVLSPSLLGSTFIPLWEVTRLETAIEPNEISHENGKRRIVITANIRDRDLGAFVQDVQSMHDSPLAYGCKKCLNAINKDIGESDVSDHG